MYKFFVRILEVGLTWSIFQVIQTAEEQPQGFSIKSIKWQNNENLNELFTKFNKYF